MIEFRGMTAICKMVGKPGYGRQQVVQSLQYFCETCTAKHQVVKNRTQ